MDITDFPDLEKGTVSTTVIPVRPTHQAVVNPLLLQLKIENIWATITALSAFTTRYYTSITGEQAAVYLLDRYQSYVGTREDITVEKFVHSGWRQPSVIATIKGKTDEVVVVGGHLDSASSGSTAPGADDDASGSATVLEIFRVLATSGFLPERTLEFHGYAAEEVGLRGSQAIANAYKAQGVVVAGMMQLDMTAYVKAQTTPTIVIITDYTSIPLNTFLRALVDEYSTTSWVNEPCGYACSDHASWNRAGYAASFPFEALNRNVNPDIHSTRDLITNLSKDHALEFAKVGLGFAVEMSYTE
jgi:leucyl aminopeptidase